MTPTRATGTASVVPAFGSTPVIGGDTRRSNMSTITIPSVDAYRAATKSEKSNMRSAANRDMLAAIDSIGSGADPVAAMATVTAIRSMMAAWTESNTRSTDPIDWSAIASVRIATLRAAADMIESGAVRPNGIPAEIELSFDSAASADIDRARRIASDPVRTHEKSDMRSAVASVVDMMVENSFYSVADVANMIASNLDAYDGRTVSHGAVRNVLESNKVSGITFVPSSASNVNGCRRA